MAPSSCFPLEKELAEAISEKNVFFFSYFQNNADGEKMDLEIWESILIHILQTLLKQESRCFFAHSTSQRPSTSLSTYSQAPVGLRERLGLVWAGGIIKM